MSKKIQVFTPYFRVEETLVEIKDCLEKGWTGMGYKTNEFEEEWCKYTNLPNAHFLNSATSGLHLAIHIYKNELNWEDGDEIITTPFTFVSSNHSILYENLTPVFADVDEFLCLSPEAVKTAITSRTRAVLFVGLGGNVGNLKKIVEICKENKLILILDAAHMSGTKWIDGNHIGNESDVVVFSYQAVKNLPSSDSGMICFKDKKLDLISRKLSWLGIDKDTFSRFSTGNYSWYYENDALGFKYHGNSVAAAMCKVSLKYLDFDNARRRDISNYYISELESIEGVSIVPISDDCIPSRHLFQLLIDNRDKVLVDMYSSNIFPGVHYRTNTEYGLYKKFYKNDCKNAEKASKQTISLPLHLNLSDNDVERVTKCFKSSVLANMN